jgi:nitrogen-specific signal transduction histidine kinase
VFPRRNAAGEIVGAVSVSRDITPLKRAEEERHLAAERRHAGEQLESLGRLAGGVAHDFNNLLTVINGYAAILADEKSVPDSARNMVREIAKSGQRAADLTKQLLIFGRRQPVNPGVVDLNRVVEDMSGMLRRLIPEDIVLKLDMDPVLGHVRADPGQLGQVIMNLVVNSRDAMPQGGILTIRTSNSGTDVPAGARVSLAVSDTGMGMDAETRRRAFEPFFTTKEVGKGTGLGLSTVDGIVKQSGGTITIESEPGHGTAIEILLPRLEERAAAVPEAVVPQESVRGTETILLAEDAAYVRDFARESLEALGYTVFAPGDGAMALTLPEDRLARVDVLVTDVVMPGLSGPDLVRRLREAKPGLKVVFISGYPGSWLDDRGGLQKGEAFLQKPFSPDDLARTIRGLLAPASPGPERQ